MLNKGSQTSAFVSVVTNQRLGSRAILCSLALLLFASCQHSVNVHAKEQERDAVLPKLQGNASAQKLAPTPKNLVPTVQRLGATAQKLVSAVQNKPLPGFVTEFLQETRLCRTAAYATSFETVDEFKKFYVVPQNYQKSATHDLSSDHKTSGEKSHKGWIYRAYTGRRGSNNNHRGYPTFKLQETELGVITSAALVELSIKADIPLENKKDKSWLSLATFTSYSDQFWYRTYLVNVSRDYRVRLMHVPQQSQEKPNIFSSDEVYLPRNEWAKLTTYMDYTPNNRFGSPFIAIWVDGKLAAASKFNDRIDLSRVPRNKYPACLDKWDGQSMSNAEELCGLKYGAGLSQMHFGLYAPPSLSSGVVYNDDLIVSRVEKLKDGVLPDGKQCTALPVGR